MLKKLGPLTFVAVFVLLSYQAVTYSSGPPNSHTNAPGEANCTACHTGTLNSGTALNNLTLTTSTSLASLQPNTSYTFTLGFSEAGKTKFGFQLCVLPAGANSGTASTGTLMATSSETFTAGTSLPSRRYLNHHSSGTSAPTGSKTWQFTYKTPATGSPNPVFYVAVNASNNDNTSAGDLIYAKAFTVSVLPVKWGDFLVKQDADGNELEWSTITEMNNERFDVERSVTGYDWKTIGTVKGNGHQSTRQTYSFTDADAPSRSFYRIRQVDYNGRYDYSKTIVAETERPPVPAPLYYPDAHAILLPDAGFSQFVLRDISGNRYEVNTVLSEGFIRLDTRGFAAGIYLLSAISGSETNYWKVLIY